LPPKAPRKKNLSTLKRARQNEKRQMRNQAVLTEIKTVRKKVISAAASKGKEAVATALKEAVKVISAAASKGVIHKSTASRNISRLTKLAGSALKGA